MLGGFVVVENTPGYLPDEEPYEFGNLVDATRYAKELVEQLSDEGYALVSEGPGFWMCVRDDADLGRVVEILVSEE
jgi:hypothetical protein